MITNPKLFLLNSIKQNVIQNKEYKNLLIKFLNNQMLDPEHKYISITTSLSFGTYLTHLFHLPMNIFNGIELKEFKQIAEEILK
jgi:hypothetical protein